MEGGGSVDNHVIIIKKKIFFFFVLEIKGPSTKEKNNNNFLLLLSTKKIVVENTYQTNFWFSKLLLYYSGEQFLKTPKYKFGKHKTKNSEFNADFHHKILCIRVNSITRSKG